jgi:RES domain-containing protein
MSGEESLERIGARLQNIQTADLRGTVFRSVAPRYANPADLISGEGARRSGGRWSPAGIHAVYGSLTLETALAEALAAIRYYGLPPEAALPRTFVAIAVRLERVLDLTDGNVRRTLGVSERRMVRTHWRSDLSAGRVPVTQTIGRAAYDAGIEALQVPSAALPDGRNLVVFPARLVAGSVVEVLGSGKL